MIEVRPATQDDVIRFYGTRILEPWEGIVMVKGDHVLGIGGLIVMEDGGVQGFMDLKGKSRRAVVFRHVLRYLAEKKRQGVMPIYTAADTRYPRAEEFLKRLGFVPTDETNDSGMRIWVCLD